MKPLPGCPHGQGSPIYCWECNPPEAFRPTHVERLNARIVRLEAALKLYGRHLASPECGAYRGTSDRDCTCGLAAALAGEEGK